MGSAAHCFNLVDSYVLDITASQFDYTYTNKIALLKIEDAKAYWWDITKKARNFAEFIKIDRSNIKFDGWHYQSPYNYKFGISPTGELFLDVVKN